MTNSCFQQDYPLKLTPQTHCLDNHNLLLRSLALVETQRSQELSLLDSRCWACLDKRALSPVSVA
jgi:hypothetical protein